MKVLGQKNIEELLLKVLEDNTSKQLCSILIGKPIVYYFGEDFSEKFMKLRVEKDISLRSLRLTQENFDSQKHKNYSWYNKEIKHIESNRFNQNIFLYDGKVLIFDMKNMECEYIDSEKECWNYLGRFNNLWNS